MQLHVERPHLIPQPIELLRERAGRHVVPRSPHRARVGEAELLRALVRQLDEALIVLAHRRRDGVPPFPCGSQRFFIPRGRENMRDVVDVLARVRFRGVGAPLALAVGRLEPRHDLRELVGLLRIRRRRQDERDLEQIQLPPLVGGYLHAVVSGGLFGEPRPGLAGGLIRAGGKRFRVVGDVGLLNPSGLARLDSELQRRLVGGVEKRLGVCDGWRRRGRRGATGNGNADRGAHQQFLPATRHPQRRDEDLGHPAPHTVTPKSRPRF